MLNAARIGNPESEGAKLPSDVYQFVLSLVIALLPSVVAPPSRGLGAEAEPPDARRLPMAVYRDKMTAGWIGQMVGVAWGAPVEFRYRNRIMPANERCRARDIRYRRRRAG
ncbi:MAG: hypothetical protein ACYTG0_31085 [Planctomycetota bacterium]|jgi:hypothetical protein